MLEWLPFGFVYATKNTMFEKLIRPFSPNA